MNKTVNLLFLNLLCNCIAIVGFAQVEVTLDTPIDVTLEASNCIGVDDCTGFQTDYVVTNLGDLDQDGFPKIWGISATSTFTFGELFTDTGTFAVTPICYNIDAIRLLIDDVNDSNQPLCCTLLNGLGQACTTIQDNFPSSDDIQDFGDVLTLVEILGTDSPSLGGFIEAVELINGNIGTVMIACPNAIAFDYCLNMEENDVYQVSFTTGIAALEKEIEALRVQPNPATDFIGVSFNHDDFGPVQLEIRSVDGRLVLEGMMNATVGENTHRWNVSALQAGVYYLVVQDGRQSSVRTVLVQ